MVDYIFYNYKILGVTKEAGTGK